MAEEDMLKLASRIRSVEGRANDLRERINFLENSLNEIKKNSREEKNEITKDLRKIDNNLEETQNAMEVIRNELSLRVPKEDFEVIKKYLDYINPVRFVTSEQVAEIVENVLEHKREIKQINK